MRATGILTPQRRPGDHLGDGDLALEVQPILPGQIEGTVAVAQTRRLKLLVDGVERRYGTLQPRAIADHADVVPHHIEQTLT